MRMGEAEMETKEEVAEAEEEDEVADVKKQEELEKEEVVVEE